MIEGKLTHSYRVIAVIGILVGVIGLEVELADHSLQRHALWLALVGLIIICIYLLTISFLSRQAHIRRAIGISLFLLELLLLIASLYYFDWSGFGTQYNPPSVQQSKTLWDWLQLLIVPALLGIGGLWLNTTLQHREQNKTEDNQREQALQTYFDRMSELLLDRGLTQPDPSEEVVSVAHIRTLTTLQRLDGVRKAGLLNFLYGSGLIGNREHHPVFSLGTADISEAHLEDMILWGAYLGSACLINANCARTQFDGARLQFTNFTKAHLENANLPGADLTKANLTEATMIGANLTEATLWNTILKKANLQEAKFEKAKLPNAILDGAILTKAYFREAMLVDVTFEYAILTESNFSDANMMNAKLVQANLRKTKLMRANLTKANLSGADLTEANLADATLVEANFTGTNLEQADIRRANLRGAKLKGAKITSEQLKTADLDETTIMPDGTHFKKT